MCDSNKIREAGWQVQLQRCIDPNWVAKTEAKNCVDGAQFYAPMYLKQSNCDNSVQSLASAMAQCDADPVAGGKLGCKTAVSWYYNGWPPS